MAHKQILHFLGLSQFQCRLSFCVNGSLFQATTLSCPSHHPASTTLPSGLTLAPSMRCTQLIYFRQIIAIRNNVSRVMRMSTVCQKQKREERGIPMSSLFPYPKIVVRFKIHGTVGHTLTFPFLFPITLLDLPI